MLSPACRLTAFAVLCACECNNKAINEDLLLFGPGRYSQQNNDSRVDDGSLVNFLVVSKEEAVGARVAHPAWWFITEDDLALYRLFSELGWHLDPRSRDNNLDNMSDTEETVAKTPRTPKQVRGDKKRIVTMGIGALRRYQSQRDIAKVKTQLTKLETDFVNFEYAHTDCHDLLTDEWEITTSDSYYDETEESYINSVDKANDWLDTLAAAALAAASASAAPVVQPSIVSPNDSTTAVYDVLSMPRVTIDSFSGDPIAYKEFMAVFDETVPKKRY